MASKGSNVMALQQTFFLLNTWYNYLYLYPKGTRTSEPLVGYTREGCLMQQTHIDTLVLKCRAIEDLHTSGVSTEIALVLIETLHLAY